MVDESAGDDGNSEAPEELPAPETEPPVVPVDEPTQSNRNRTIIVTVVVTAVVIAGIAFIVQSRSDRLGPIAEAACEEQEARDRLPQQMEIDIVSCDQDEVRGRVTNNSDLVVDLYIDIILYRNDLQVGDGIATVRNLEPGRTATWDSSVFERYTECRAIVGSVFEAD